MRMRAILTISVGFIFFGSCDTVDDIIHDKPNDTPFQEIQWEQDVTGQLLPWELIQNPEHTPASEIEYMNDTEMVFISKVKGYVFVYPLRFMGVEVVNEDIDGVLVAVTYCPITKSANVWNRLLESDTLLLTASGYLLRDNLMPLDLNSGSIWSQMRLVGMSGKHDMMTIKTVPLFETSWKTVRVHFPDASVFTNDRQKKLSLESTSAEFGEGFTDRQFGVLSRDRVELFNAQLFSEGTLLYSSTVQPGGRVVVVGSSDPQYVTAFRTSYVMQPVEDEFPIIMRDETGTSWNIFGEAVDGERQGEQLESPVYYTASGWAWELLFSNTFEFSPS
jgi:hypothetical protein